MKALIFIGVIFVLLAVYVISVYNKLIGMIEAVNNNNKQIDIQLDRRYKVFESLINVVKEYMDYEKTVLKDVVALRSQAVSSAAGGDQKGRIDAENAISRLASNINVMFENYPDLKANQNALQLQEEISNTENKLAYAKQAFNDSIERYNATKKSFFESMVVSLFSGKLNKDFIYWNLTEDTIKEREEYTVKL